MARIYKTLQSLWGQLPGERRTNNLRHGENNVCVIREAEKTVTEALLHVHLQPRGLLQMLREDSFRRAPLTQGQAAGPS